MASLERNLQVFESLDGRPLDGLDELQPDDRKGIGIFSLLLDFTHESWSQGRKKILDSGAIVVLVILIVEEELRSAKRLCSLDSVPGVTLDDVGHRERVFWIR